ncbi:tRNA (adenosine(37)-N6)-dimethylallyltransferase MiaA [bacterium]|nr:tRNA (adenosine(37)-N6)-dimethylallyltransferase MiaA [bacterium]MBU1674353.1 tRNA (adenosine(37)-N6)-dimethylallyltransferase MiaA [bacterium]
MGARAGTCGVCPVIAGPTAVGKTALTVSLARRHPIEIVSLDSRQIYRGLRIGTAQPTAEERAACPHHLVDFLSPRELYSAQLFREDFCRAVDDIRSRGRLPLLVGGAGLYLTAVRDGFFAVPRTAPHLTGVRADLDALDDAAVRERLRRVDAASFARIHPHDRYRSQRALEIHRLTGRTMTEIMSAREADPALGLSFPLVLLDRERSALRSRIAARTAGMLSAGWLEETRELLGEFGPDAPGLRTLGYHDLVLHLVGDRSLPDTRERIVASTARYAKRQRTWFRAQTREAYGDPDDPRLLEAIEALLRRAVAKG